MRYAAGLLLSDSALLDARQSGEFVIEPYEPELLQPASIDMRLDRFFRVFVNHRYAVIDPREPQPELTVPVELSDDTPFILHPGEFALGSTLETVTLGTRLAARVEGKSSLGRLGLLVHSTAGFVDPGFSGAITLELANVANLPIKLWPGMKIGQLCIFRLASPATHPYGAAACGSHYQDQPRGPQPSRGWRNFRTWPTREKDSTCA